MDVEISSKLDEIKNLMYSLLLKVSYTPEVKESIDKLRSESANSSNEIKAILIDLSKPKDKTIIEQDALVSKEIRDTAVHRTEIIEIGQFDIVTIWINNELDKDVTVQVKGNFTKTYVNAVNVGNSFTVAANSVEARNLSVYREAWLPFSFCEIVAVQPPTKGAIHVKYLKRSSWI